MTGEIDIEKVEEFLLEQEKNDKFSGAVLIANDNKTVFKKAYGLASKTYNVLNQIDTKFNVGSINKMFTKTAILQLVDRNQLNLDDLVGQHLPEFPSEIGSKVTVRHLLTFTSGMGDYFNERFVASAGSLRTLDDFVKLFIDDPLSFAPGEQKQYSNAGYVVLGKIIEAVSGQDYYEYIKENIYKPAGMNSSDHYERDYPEPNVATGYTMHSGCSSGEKGTERRENHFLIGTKGSSAGGGFSTLDDLVAFEVAIQENKILSPEASKRVFRPINDDPGRRMPGFVIAGGAPGISAFFDKNYDLGIAIIVLSNYDPDETEPVYSQLRKIVHGLEEGSEKTGPRPAPKCKNL
ncbi:MAG: serine hydrolase domain-containing protein [Candidatus Thorarchaeota archaeon]|jgi:CubicO group peptidase (beta-lactamase class C family)